MRKFAIVPAIVAGVLFLNANSASAGCTTQAAGHEVYFVCTNGGLTLVGKGSIGGSPYSGLFGG